MYVFFFMYINFTADKITVYLWHDDITNDMKYGTTDWRIFLSTHIQHFSNVVHLLYVFRFPPSVYSLIVWAPMAVLASTEETNKQYDTNASLRPPMLLFMYWTECVRMHMLAWAVNIRFIY